MHKGINVSIAQQIDCNGGKNGGVPGEKNKFFLVILWSSFKKINSATSNDETKGNRIEQQQRNRFGCILCFLLFILTSTSDNTTSRVQFLRSAFDWLKTGLIYYAKTLNFCTLWLTKRRDVSVAEGKLFDKSLQLWQDQVVLVSAQLSWSKYWLRTAYYLSAESMCSKIQLCLKVSIRSLCIDQEPWLILSTDIPCLFITLPLHFLIDF